MVEKTRYWRHYKGGTYKEIARGRLESNLTPVVVYESLREGSVWVRLVDDFEGNVEIVHPMDSSGVIRTEVTSTPRFVEIVPDSGE